jgi:hypothetical protein
VLDYGWLLGGGGFFIVLGLVLLFIGRGEERGYYNSLPDHADAREFLTHWPPRIRLGSVKIGGKVAIAVGLALLIAGIIFWIRA